MFDDDFTAMWHSHFRFEDQVKVIGVEFYVSTIILETWKNITDTPIIFRIQYIFIIWKFIKDSMHAAETDTIMFAWF